MEETQKQKLPLAIWVYVLGLVFAIYILREIFQYADGDANNLFIQWMQAVDVGIHEISHNLAGGLGEFMRYASGPIGQFIPSVLMVVAAIYSKKYFSLVFAGLWLSRCIVHTGQYMAVSRSHEGSFVTSNLSGEMPQFLDWEYIFTQFGVLEKDVTIGKTVIAFGLFIGVVSVAYGIYLLVVKFREQSAADKAKFKEELLEASGTDNTSLAFKILGELNMPPSLQKYELLLYEAYGQLAREKGAETTAVDAHRVWLAWAHDHHPDSEYRIPFDKLPPYKQQMFERDAAAIRTVASTTDKVDTAL